MSLEDEIFSRVYDAGAQKEFEKALDSHNIEKAKEILDNFPNYDHPRIEESGERKIKAIAGTMERNIVLVEGYKALTDFLMEIVDVEDRVSPLDRLVDLS
jgi:hypothetical protein